MRRDGVTRVLLVTEDRQRQGLFLKTIDDKGIGWEVRFADNDGDALEAAAQQSFDVVLAEQGGAAVSGAELLVECRNLHRRCVRLLIASDKDLGSALRKGAVHRALPRSASVDSLVQAVDRAVRIEDSLDSPELKDALRGMGELPTAPTVYLELSRVLEQAEVDLDEVAAVIASEPLLVARVLQVVNSSYFGLAREFGALREALVFLGTEPLRGLVLATYAFAPVEHGLAPEVYSIDAERVHSLAVAGVARKLITVRNQVDLAFLAGLLHDVGRRLLAVHAPDVLRSAHERAQDYPDHTRYELESEVSGVTHAAVGAYLLDLWGVPKCVVEAVAEHHTPVTLGEGPPSQITAAICLADSLLREVEGETPQHDQLCLRELDAPHDLSPLRSQVEEELQHASDLAAAF